MAFRQKSPVVLEMRPPPPQSGCDQPYAKLEGHLYTKSVNYGLSIGTGRGVATTSYSDESHGGCTACATGSYDRQGTSACPSPSPSQATACAVALPVLMCD